MDYINIFNIKMNYLLIVLKKNAERNNNHEVIIVANGIIPMK